jgi:hypothetical protein
VGGHGEQGRRREGAAERPRPHGRLHGPDEVRRHRAREPPDDPAHEQQQHEQRINAYGNNNFQPDYTFQQSKLSTPNYIQHYFGTDATGNPIASLGVQNKSDATAKGVAYSHPYFTLTTAQITAIQAFTDDAIAKYKAGTCTAPPPPTP